uniref:Transmembrane protein n=1 Tax=Medicago truncatula TaxID=3880 RepID=I3S955_MEDTR|nr:unknown [Medicago truncatula]
MSGIRHSLETHKHWFSLFLFFQIFLLVFKAVKWISKLPSLFISR